MDQEKSGEDTFEAIFFAEKEEVMKVITSISSDNKEWEYIWVTKWKYLENTMNKYQEQPLLLAPHMADMMDPCTDCILHILESLTPEDRTNMNIGFQRILVPQVHAVCKVIRLLCKVRGFKHVIKLFPHEVYHFEICLFLLRTQDSTDYENWETRYVLLLWLTMLSLIPFDICSMDSTISSSTGTGGRLSPVPSMEKSKLVMDIIDTCKGSLSDPGPTREAAASCLATLLTRPDMDRDILDEVLSWFCDFLNTHNEKNEDMISFSLVGILQCLAQVFKRGHRNNVLPHVPVVLGPCLKISMLENNQTLTRKLITKLVQWLGMTTLAPRVASWRYMRGQRSLLTNLGTTSSAVGENLSGESAQSAVVDDADSYDIPGDLEDIIEHLLCSLRDKDTVVRWSAAKGIGRITMRLPRDMADDITMAVLEQFNDADNDLAWHGCCLALAELSRRGLLLPVRLGDVVPLIKRAIHFDVMRGQHSVGLHVRDAACYVCWAFARAYSPTVMKPYISELSSAMLLTALFDREINCRRAASAAFQENVGRQGNANFPLGIDIIAVADYFSLGNRIMAYQSIAPRIAAMDMDIHLSIISHLHLTKLPHWDSEIRELAAKSLAKMVPVNPLACIEIMKRLVVEGTSTSLYKRHGAVLGLSGMLIALRACDAVIAHDVLDSIVQLVPQIDKARLYRGKGGELLRQASCLLIESIAKCNIPMPMKTQVVLVESLNENLKQPHDYIRISACNALRQFLHVYFPVNEQPSENLQKLTVLKYVTGLDTEENVAVTRGYSLAIGALPAKLVLLPSGRLETILETLFNASKLDKKIGGEADSETRRNCVESAVELVGKVCCSEQFTSSHLLKCFDILFRACEDYNIDKRGDTGSWSRISALRGLERLLGIYFSFFSSYPQDPASFAFSGYVRESDPKTVPIIGSLVASSYGYGIVEELSAVTKLASVRYSPNSLGASLNQTDAAELCIANLQTIANRIANTGTDASLLPEIKSRGITDEGSDHVIAHGPLCKDLLGHEKIQEFVVETFRIVFKQLSEKLDAVRDVAGRILERLIYSVNPAIGYIIDRKKIISTLDANYEAIQSIEERKVSRSWASPAVAYHFVTLALEIDTYFESIVSGIIISVGGLSEAVVKESSGVFLKWCRAKKGAENYRQLEKLATVLISLYDKYAFDDRVIVPLLKTTDMLLKHDIFYFLAVNKHDFANKLLQYVRAEINKSSDVGKLRLCIELLILLLGFEDPVRPAALRSLVMLAGHRYPKVRKHASDLLYLQLLSDANAVGPSPSEVEGRINSNDSDAPRISGLATSHENLEKANEVLMGTSWDNSDLVMVRACRDELAIALGISIATAVAAAPKTKAEVSDELNSYISLVRDAGY